MLQSIRSFFRAVPTPLAGLALGIASLGMGIEKSLPLHNVGQVLGALTSMTLTLLLAGKFALNPRLLVVKSCAILCWAAFCPPWPWHLCCNLKA